MKKILLYLLYFALWISPLHSQNLLSGKYSRQDLKQLLIPRDQWAPFPRLNDRQSWEKADQGMMQSYVQQAENYLNYTWPYIPATASLQIVRTGNRSGYEKISGEKRNVLGILLLAEIAENKGRFIDQIIDGIWSICEDSWWGAPAHLPKTEEFSGLADVSDPFADLTAAGTGALLAWTDYFLGDRLDAVSPQIRKRIYYEVNLRLMQPLMTKYKNTSHQYHMWMGEYPNGRAPNNWNPWISSNWLCFVLLLEKDENKRIETVAKILHVLDQYINPYPQDGGCDEGPGYWGAAPASLYDDIFILNSAFGDAFRYVFENEKIRNMAKYIYRVQISEEYFLNFSDASPKPRIPASLVYRYGKDIEDKDVMGIGAYYQESANERVNPLHFTRNLYSVFMQEEYRNAEQHLALPQDVWFPDLQVMAGRDKGGLSKGFYLAAKGGNNGESHNHNDVGSYVIFYDGLPLLIDIGSGTYTARTFSSSRYDIWYNGSDYHNLPTVNGFTQLADIQCKASSVSYKSSGSRVEFSLDIAGTYPDKAGINSWKRTIQYNRGNNIQIKDLVDLEKVNSVTEHMMTCYPVDVLKPGEVTIHYRTKEGKNMDFVVLYNHKQMQAQVEKIKLEAEEDRGVKERWGDNIYRISFEVIAPKAKDLFTFSIKKK